MNELEANDYTSYFLAYSGSNEYIVGTLDPGITFACNISHTLISADTKEEVINQAADIGIVIEPEDFEENYYDESDYDE
jgi:hypothetical protein